MNTHGTSTLLGDASEVRALRRVFEGRRVRYSSTKGYTGHTVSAAGAMEAIFTLSMLGGGWIAPSVHAEPLDAELRDYPPVLNPTAAPLRLALSNSLGFRRDERLVGARWPESIHVSPSQPLGNPLPLQYTAREGFAWPTQIKRCASCRRASRCR